MNEWKIALREELELGLTAFVDDGAFEIPVKITPNFEEGVIDLTWRDDNKRDWILTFRRSTLVALAEAMQWQ